MLFYLSIHLFYFIFHVENFIYEIMSMKKNKIIKYFRNNKLK